PVMGRVLAGSEELMTQVAIYCNSCCLAMSPFNARQLLSGVETLSLRMEKQLDNALKIAQWLQQQPQVQALYYTGMPDH
ncbi:PLP-dependent transferase, partial [Neisseria sp. P0014.S006]|uniref:PLP-dependent transferase n=1 Tax=Neisseria sp. P0014.S006 TaxID=3436752 RepID=UPI003F7CDDA5